VNSAAVRALAGWAERNGIELLIDEHLSKLPPFDPDHERAAPQAVVGFRGALERADAVLLAVPEYAFGIPGAFKNAIDWTVGSGSLDGKPVAVLSVAPPGRGADVRQALGRVLTAVNARFTHHHVPVLPADRDDAGEIRNPEVLRRLGDVVAALSRRSGAGEPSVASLVHIDHEQGAGHDDSTGSSGRG
jgi:NAD(P)H-dependent FMN reductase